MERKKKKSKFKSFLAVCFGMFLGFVLVSAGVDAIMFVLEKL